jgi:AcrR family transcriptional regulator
LQVYWPSRKEVTVPKVSEDYVKARKRQVLDGAAASFAQKGYHAATVDDICAQAGLSKGAVYGYFASKEDIVSALKVESVQRDAAVIRASMQRREPDEAFGAMLDWVAGGDEMDARRLADIQSWAEALLNQRILDAQVIESQLWVDALEVLVQKAQQEGAITERLDSKAVAQMLACVVYGAMAMKSWDANFNVRAINGVARALLTGNIVEK